MNSVGQNVARPDWVEALRRVVLSESDKYSDTAIHLLQVMGFPECYAWARVEGVRLIVFIGGDGNEDAPEVGARLVADLGGHAERAGMQTDPHWVWIWEAALNG